jgi:tRNA-Thr(GGU) m(6)t(6)A37 methyltransferase TsaA
VYEEDVMKICYEPIGVMHCELDSAENTPCFYNDSDVQGTIEIFSPFLQGIEGLEEYEHIVVLFHFHLSKGYSLKQKRRGTGRLKGVFSLCSPMRPNPIGMSILKLIRVAPPLLFVDNVDMVDGTPILDIKPYKPLEPKGV